MASAVRSGSSRRRTGPTRVARSTSRTCRQAREAVFAAGQRPVDVTYVGDWHLHDGFLTAVADHVVVARDTLPADACSRPRGWSSRPQRARHDDGSGAAIASSCRPRRPKSRGGSASPTGPWSFRAGAGAPRTPGSNRTSNDYLRAEHARGNLEAVILSPIGFVCDHIEVLYDLDHEARATCDRLDLPMARARPSTRTRPSSRRWRTWSCATWETYKRGRPITLVHPDQPNCAGTRRHRSSQP